MNYPIAFVTGSSQGIGREIAYQFAKAGYGVIVTYNRSKKAADETAAQCTKLGSADVLMISLDVTNDKSILAAVKKIADKYKKIDVLVNNAGVLTEGWLKEQTFEQIEAQVRTNLEGLIKVTKACLPLVKESIINISSGLGKSVMASLSVYCATKWGVRGFTQALAEEYPGLTIASVNPGSTATQMTDFSGVHPEKVAAIAFNAAHGKYHIHNGGDVDVWKLLGSAE